LEAKRRSLPDGSDALSASVARLPSAFFAP